MNLKRSKEKLNKLDYEQIEIKWLLQKAKQSGFESIEDFVRANLHYLPKWKQELFHFFEKS